MDKSGKLYVKAMNKYNDGYIDKALFFCEKSISINITNSAALNLKGILYYLKGDLENAKSMWNINYKRNDDAVSKKYLKDSIKDKEKLQLYLDALELIRQLNISGALIMLKQCGNSHFNFINVNNSISLCYIKQGEYDKALEHINEVLKVDKKNKEALSNRKTLIEYGSVKKEINYKKIGIVTASIIFTALILFLGKTYMHNVKDLSLRGIQKIQSGIALIKGKSNDSVNSTEKYNVEKPEQIKKDTEAPKEDSGSNENKALENKPQDIQRFPNEKFAESIKNNNMEQIMEFVKQWENADLDMNDKLLMLKGKEVIAINGVAYFYEKSTKYIEAGKYKEAQSSLLDILPYSKDSYLQEHIIYMLALSYKANSNFQEAVKYYELSLNQFPKGSYVEEVIYNLIIINKDIDSSKAKKYAEILISQFPSSQYNNSVVQRILK